MTREPVSEHYRSGPLGPRVRAALTAERDCDVTGVDLSDELVSFVSALTSPAELNLTAGRIGVAQIVATRAER